MSIDDNDKLADALLSQDSLQSGLLSAIRSVLDEMEIESPRWGYWQQVGNVKLWEAILLSCGQDPMWRTRNERYTQSQAAVWGALSSCTNGQAAERLEIAVSRIGIDMPLFSLDQEKPTRSRVELQKFATWANALSWQLPPDLKAIVASGDGGNSHSSASAAMDGTERVRLLKLVGALSLLLAEQKTMYRRGDRPNGSQLAEAVASIVEAIPDANSRGLGVSNTRASISEGLTLLKG